MLPKKPFFSLLLLLPLDELLLPLDELLLLLLESSPLKKLSNALFFLLPLVLLSLDELLLESSLLK